MTRGGVVVRGLGGIYSKADMRQKKEDTSKLHKMQFVFLTNLLTAVAAVSRQTFI